MKLVYTCACCNKTFTKTATKMFIDGAPVMCPHCKEVMLIQWTHITLE